MKKDKKHRYIQNTMNLICLAYIGIPEELKNLSIMIIILLTTINAIQKIKSK